MLSRAGRPGRNLSFRLPTGTRNSTGTERKRNKQKSKEERKGYRARSPAAAGDGRSRVIAGCGRWASDDGRRVVNGRGWAQTAGGWPGAAAGGFRIERQGEIKPN